MGASDAKPDPQERWRQYTSVDTGASRAANDIDSAPGFWGPEPQFAAQDLSRNARRTAGGTVGAARVPPVRPRRLVAGERAAIRGYHGAGRHPPRVSALQSLLHHAVRVLLPAHDR